MGMGMGMVRVWFLGLWVVVVWGKGRKEERRNECGLLGWLMMADDG